MELNFNKLIKPVPRNSIFKMKDWYIWGGSMVEHDGLYYLIFSRWPKSNGFGAWVTKSEIGCAVSKNPLGPYTFKKVILQGSNNGNWDSDVVHNPTLLKYKNKYYLYYMGNKGDGKYWTHRNNQRIGVAIADNPLGPWERFSEPVIDVSINSYDHLLTSNPTVTITKDGKILMVYKAVGDGEMPKGGRVICGLAVANNPLGPFKKYHKPIMINPENDWSVEDPYIWLQDDKYYALVKDFQGYFTKKGKSTIALFESFDGINWEPAHHAFALKPEIRWEDGVVENVKRLERPQLWLENGKPKVLFCAVATNDEPVETYNIHIPLD